MRGQRAPAARAALDALRDVGHGHAQRLTTAAAP